MLRRLSTALALALLTALLSGCLNSKSVDNFGYALVIGVDEGEGRKYDISFLLQKDSQDSGGKQQPTGLVLSAEGDSIFEAVETVISGAPFEMNFSRVGTVAIADSVAYAGGVEEIFLTSFTALNIRQSIKLIVTTSTAKEFLEGFDYENMPNLTRLQSSILQNYAIYGTTNVMNVSMFTQAVMTGRSDPAVTLCGVDKSVKAEKEQQSSPAAGAGGSAGGGGGGGTGGEDGGAEYTTGGVKRSGGMSSYALGCAVFDGWNMAGVLDGDDTRLLLMVKGEFKTGNITFAYEGDIISIWLKHKRPPRVEMELFPEPHAKVFIELYCEIDMDTGARPERGRRREITQRLQTYMEGELLRVFNKCRGMSSDAMRFGTYASMKFTDTKAWEEYKWKEKYGGMSAEFDVVLTQDNESMVSYTE